MAAADLPDRLSDPKPAARRASYRSGFAFGTLSFCVITTLGLASTIITARLYGVRIIGEFALVTVPVAALWALSSVKEQQALIKQITDLPPHHPRVTQLFAAVFTFSSVLTVAVALADCVVCWFVFRGPLNAPELLTPTFVSIAGRATVTNTGWNLDSILSAFVAGRQIFWVRLNEALGFILIAMAIGLVWRSVWGLVIATVGGSLTALVHRMIAVRPFVRARLSWQEYRAGMQVLPDLLRFGLKATPGQVAQGFSQQAGIWALGIVAPVTVVGAYSRAQNVPQRLQQATNRITEVLYPTLVGRHAKGDRNGFDRVLIDSIRYEMIGMLLIAATLGGAAHSVLDVFGPGFSGAAPALALLMLFPALASVTATQTQALWATNQPGRTSVIAILRLAVTLALLVVLTPSIDIIGPAIALLAGYLLVIALSGFALRAHLARPLHATWPLRERLALLAAYSAGFAAAHVTEQLASSVTGLLICLLVSLSAGTVLYAAAFFVFGGINPRDRPRMAEAIRMARAWRKREAQQEARVHSASPTTAVVDGDASPAEQPNARLPQAELDAASG